LTADRNLIKKIKPGFKKTRQAIFFAAAEEKHKFEKWKIFWKKGKVISISLEVLFPELICISPNIIDL